MYKTRNIELYISIHLCTSYLYLKKENPNLSVFMCDKNKTHIIWSYEWNECKMTVITLSTKSNCLFPPLALKLIYLYGIYLQPD